MGRRLGLTDSKAELHSQIPGRRKRASIWHLGSRKPGSPSMPWLQRTNTPVQNSRRKSSGWPSLGPVANPQLGSWMDSSPGTSHTGEAITARGEESEGEGVAEQSHVRMSAIHWTAQESFCLWLDSNTLEGFCLKAWQRGCPAMEGMWGLE